MQNLLPTISFILGTLTLVSHLGVAVLVAAYFLHSGAKKAIIEFFHKYGMQLGFFFVALSTVASYSLSNIFGVEPCNLCWWQRIFVYPVALILGLGLIKKETQVIKYAQLVLGVGLIFALYHTLLQWEMVPAGLCAAVSGSSTVSCGQRYIWEYNYITIPLMNLTGIVLAMGSLWLSQKKQS